MTTRTGLAAWLGEAEVDPRAGGAFDVRLISGTTMDGIVVAIDPPERLVLAWHETDAGVPLHYATTADDRSAVSFALASLGRGTSLVLEHRLIRGGEVMSSFGAGWHAVLDALRAVLDGRPPGPVAAVYEVLHPSYVRAMRDVER